jgi:hypothetical protein
MDKCQRLFFQDRSDLRSDVLNPDERLLVLRATSHNAMIVRQTNEQVKRANFIARGRAPVAETPRPKSFRPSLAGL